MACGRTSPDFLKSGVLGAKRTSARVQKGLRTMRKPPEAIARLGRALGGACKNDGGSARWRFAGRGVPATGVAYGVQAMVKKHQGDGLNLTKGAGWPE